MKPNCCSNQHIYIKLKMENVDWESVKSKYEDILAIMREELPETKEEAKELTKEYTHTKEEVTKSILTTKLKNNHLRYRKAVDSGRRSGHVRVVFIYYELCEKIWGGSPATDQIDGGLETTDIADSITSHQSDTSAEHAYEVNKITLLRYLLQALKDLCVEMESILKERRLPLAKEESF